MYFPVLCLNPDSLLMPSQEEWIIKGSYYTGHYTASINCYKNILLQWQQNYGVWIFWQQKLLYCICHTWWINWMLVTFGVSFKQHFDSRYLVSYNLPPPPPPPSLGCFCPCTFFQNIRFSMVPSDPLMSHLPADLGYSAGEFQALQLIVLVAFGVVD